MKNNIVEIFKRIPNDFKFWSSFLVLPQKQWHMAPNKMTIASKPFKLASFQSDYVDYLNSDINVKVIVKPRQVGFTTVSLAWALWQVLYHKNIHGSYITADEITQEDFISTLRTMIDSLHPALVPKYTINQSGIINVPGLNSQLKIKCAGKGNKSRGKADNFTFFDEFAFYDRKVQRTIQAAVSAASINVIYLTTPASDDDIYYSLVEKARANKTIFEYRFFNCVDEWFGSMENAQAHYDKIASTLSPTQVKRELDCEFSGIADNLVWDISDDMLVPYYPNIIRPAAIVSLDIGYNPDPTAILYAVEYSGVLYVIAEDIKSCYTMPLIIETIKRRNFIIKYGIMDSNSKKTDQTSGLSCYTMLRNGLRKPVFTRKLPNQAEMVRIAQHALSTGRLKINPNTCPQLVQAFNNLTWQNDRVAKNKYKHIHDAFVYLALNYFRSQGTIKSKIQIPKDLHLSL